MSPVALCSNQHTSDIPSEISPVAAYLHLDFIILQRVTFQPLFTRYMCSVHHKYNIRFCQQQKITSYNPLISTTGKLLRFVLSKVTNYYSRKWPQIFNSKILWVWFEKKKIIKWHIYIIGQLELCNYLPATPGWWSYQLQIFFPIWVIWTLKILLWMENWIRRWDLHFE